MFIHAYLHASTDQQDSKRAKDRLAQFAADRGLMVASYYCENVSGASLQRPELFRLLEESQEGDVAVLEHVDMLSQLTNGDWEKLKAEIKVKGVRIVALDLPASWGLLTATQDDFTGRMVAAINDILLDMLAALARKDYEGRHLRQARGIEKAKTAGLYRGRRENVERNAAIFAMLMEGKTWNQVIAATGASRATLSKIARRAVAETITPVNPFAPTCQSTLDRG